MGRAADLARTVERLTEGSSILLTGPAGVGKSRLAEEACAALATSYHVERLIGSPSVQQLPFGAVAHLGADAMFPEPAVLVTYISRTVRQRSGDKPTLLFVDDIDLLDDSSLAVVEHMITRESIPVLATARSDGAAEPRVVQLWKDGIVERDDLGPLERDEADELAAAIVGGVCTAELTNEVWRLTEGHPLFARELLLEAAGQEAIAQSDDVWGLQHSLGASQRVADIVALRTAHLNMDELDGLRVVALCEPVSLHVARDVLVAEVLQSLEEKQLVRLEPTTAGPVLRSSHPLIAEVTLGQMPGIARGTTSARLARVLLEAPTLTAADALRAALWLLDAGEMPPQEVAIKGARAALRSFDPALARRLAEAALAQGDSQEATVLLGRAFAAAGEAPQAISLLHNARRTAANEAELAAASVALTEVHMFILGAAQDAANILEATLEGLSEPGPRAEISSHLMLAVGIIGDFDLGLRIGPQVVDRLDLPEPAQLTSVMAMTLTQTMTGKLDDIIDRLDRGDALADRYSDLQPFAPDQVGLNRLMAHQAFAEFAQAEHYANTAIRRGVGLPGPWLFTNAVSRQFTGDVAKARRLAAEAESHLADLDPLGLEPMANGIRALFESMGGAAESAASLIERVRKDPRGAQTRAAVWADRAEAWNVAQSGESAAAAELARQAGLSAIGGTHYVWGAFALHDAVRFGRAAEVVEALTRLRDESRGPLVELLADQAVAMAAGDLTALEAVANRSREIGATALVAECHAAAAAVCTGVRAVRHSHLALLHFRRCSGFRSPLMGGLDAPITDRQFEVASLAATGSTSKDIARQLHLSARTVDNHLRSVYARFDIKGRADLPALFPA